MDLDGDGDVDIVSAEYSLHQIRWHENQDGGRLWKTRVIAVVPNPTSVTSVDLDGDGHADVLSASGEYNGTFSWYKNDGSGVFTRQGQLTEEAYQPRAVLAADLDGDDDSDVLSADVDYISWYENDGDGSFSERRTIESVYSGRSLYASDLDGDGDTDVLGAYANTVSWYENQDATFYAHYIAVVGNPSSVFASDLDGDGDNDVLSAFGDKIAWFENEGDRTFADQRLISTTVEGATSVFATDLDGDGDADVLSASVRDDKIAWYENDGTGVFSGQRVITDQATFASTVSAVDIDGDGDQDVLSASFGQDAIRWYENLGLVEDDHGDTPETATIIGAPPRVVDGNLERPEDRDVFRVEVAEGGVLRISTTGDTDTYGTLTDASAAVLDEDDDSGTGFNFMMETLVQAGTYYVQVRGYSTSTMGRYELSTSWEPAPIVSIPDAGLRGALETALGKVPGVGISQLEMATLATLSARDMDVAGLDGLQFATGLEELDLGSNEIVNVEAIASLVALRRLILDFNAIENLSPLESLHELEWVELDFNMIADLSPLRNVTGLRHLWLNGNAIVDLEPLADLVELETLHLYGNLIDDLSPLASLTRLTRLNLAGNAIRDIGALENLSGLAYLDLSTNDISDTLPLANNLGIGRRSILLGIPDEVLLDGNPLNTRSVDEDIPSLRRRGVKINYTRPSDEEDAVGSSSNEHTRR